MALSPFPIPRELRQTDVLDGDGGASYGPFNFRIFDIEDVTALVRPAAAPTFSPAAATIEKVSGAPFDFFTVTFDEPVPVGAHYLIAGIRLGDRSAGVRKGSGLSPDALEKEFSKLTAQAQELRRDVGRALLTDYGAEPQVLPPPDDKSFLGWQNGRLENRLTEGASAAEAEGFRNEAEEFKDLAEAAAAAAALREPFLFNFPGNGTAGPYDIGANIVDDTAIALSVDGAEMVPGADFTYVGSLVTFTWLAPPLTSRIHGRIYAVRGIGQPGTRSVGDDELKEPILDLLDPLRGTHAGGIVYDDAIFAAIRANPLLADADIDLRFGTHLVADFPPGRFHNGFWRKLNAIGALTVDYPAFDTIATDYMRLSQGAVYEGWFQGKAHKYKDVIYAVTNYAPTHGATSGAIKMRRSLDGGHSWTGEEALFLPASGRVTSWSAGQFNGQQFVVVQAEDSGGVLQSIKLFARRLFDFYDQQPLRVETFAGQSRARIHLANAGVRPGDIFRAVSGFGTIAGIAFNVDFTVTDCRNSYFEIELGANASVNSDQTYTARFAFPEGAFTEVLFGGSSQDFGTFMVANTSLGSLPNLVHDFTARRVASVDALYFGISSGNTDAILKVTNIFRTAGNRAIEWLKQLPGAGPNVSEPTVCTDGVAMFGFLRHQAAPDTARARFWWSDDDLATITAYDLPGGRAAAFLSPIAIDVFGDYLIAAMTGDRMPEAVGATEVPLMLLYSKKADAKTNAWTSWTVIHLGPLPRTPSGSSAIGVPSVVVHGRKAFIFFGAEEAPQGKSATLQGTIANAFCLAVDLDFLTGDDPYEAFVGPTALGPARLALIEIDRGQAANGDRWIRFSDGSLSCFSRPLPSGTTSTASGNVFTTVDLSWDYPIPFADSPIVTGYARRTGGNGVGWLGNLALGAGPYAHNYRVVASANDYQANVYLTATGRWF